MFTFPNFSLTFPGTTGFLDFSLTHQTHFDTHKFFISITFIGRVWLLITNSILQVTFYLTICGLSTISFIQDWSSTVGMSEEVEADKNSLKVLSVRISFRYAMTLLRNGKQWWASRNSSHEPYKKIMNKIYPFLIVALYLKLPSRTRHL